MNKTVHNGPDRIIILILSLLPCFIHAQNVGIGTTAPTEKLHIIGNIRMDNSARGVILDAENAPLITRGFDPFVSGSYTGLGRWGLFMEPANLTLGIPAVAGRNIQFATYNDNSTIQATLMSILQNGNVGINTNAPAALLHVYQDADVWHSFIGGASGRLQIGGQTGNGAVIQSWNPGTNAARDLYLQRDGGNVGIGTTSPQQLLDVNGSVRISGALMPLNNAGVAGQVLSSNGLAFAPAWISPTNSIYNSAIHVEQSVASAGPSSNGSVVAIPGLTTTFTLTGNAKVMINFSVTLFSPGCSFCGNSQGLITMLLDNVAANNYDWQVSNGDYNTITGSRIFSLAAGSHTINLQFTNPGSLNIVATSTSPAINYLEALQFAQ